MSQTTGQCYIVADQAQRKVLVQKSLEKTSYVSFLNGYKVVEIHQTMNGCRIEIGEQSWSINHSSLKDLISILKVLDEDQEISKYTDVITLPPNCT